MNYQRSIDYDIPPLPERLRAAGALYQWLQRLLNEAAEEIERLTRQGTA